MGWGEDLITEDTIMFGMPRNNPYITPLENCRYDCCITIPGGVPPGNGVDYAVFKGGKYVVYEFEEAVEYNQ